MYQPIKGNEEEPRRLAYYLGLPIDSSMLSQKPVENPKEFGEWEEDLRAANSTGFKFGNEDRYINLLQDEN